MSKNVKIYRSSHFGAPELKGDTYGYLVNLLRIVGTQGYNTHTDITTYSSSDGKLTINFSTAHNYVEGQVLVISNSSNINGEYLVISTPTPNTIVLIIADQETQIPNISLSAGIGISIKVAPLGIKEKWRDGNRSVFTLDESTENCFFYIDDEVPANWTQYTMVTPLIFITDSMSDINTVDGRFILPYDTANPTYYKLKSYSIGSIPKSGLWVWISYLMRANSAVNTALAASMPAEWVVIGNGRFFYYILQNTTDKPFYSTNKFPVYFGKFKKNPNIDNNVKNYVLIGKSTLPANNQFTDINISSSSKGFFLSNHISMQTRYTTDIGPTDYGLLNNYNGTSTSLAKFSYTKNIGLLNGEVQITRNIDSFPSLDGMKFKANKIYIFDSTSTYIGDLPGCLTSSQLKQYNDNALIKSSDGIRYKYLYNFDFSMNISNTASTATVQNFTISLDYKEWENYE